VPHVRRKQWEHGVEIDATSAPVFHAVHREGVSNVVEPWAVSPTSMSDANGTQGTPEDRVGSVKRVRSTMRGREENGLRWAYWHRGRVESESSQEPLGNGHKAVLPELTLPDFQDSHIEIDIPDGQPQRLSAAETTPV
jgi:hypothetical protein